MIEYGSEYMLKMVHPPEDATYHHSKGDAGVRRLTEGFTHDGTQTVWEVQNDKSLEVGDETKH